jgi:NitT/TauT family transport system substrate-binding protein
MLNMGRALALVLLFIGILSAGCVPSRTPERMVVKVGHIPIVDLAGLYLAIDKGYFAQEGIQVELTAMAGGATILPAVAAGSLDVGFSNVLSIILARNQGFDFIIVAHVDNEDTDSRTHMVIVKGNSPIETPKDLMGKHVAVNTLNNIEHLMTQEWLERKGVNPAGVTFIELSFPDMPPALLQGHVDAIVTSEPYGTIAINQGGRVLGYEYTETVPDSAIASFVTTERWAKENPEVLQRFVRAYRRGAAEATADPLLQRQVIPKFAGVQSDLAQQMRLVTLKSMLDPAQLQWWADKALERGLLKQAMDTRNLISETAR